MGLSRAVGLASAAALLLVGCLQVAPDLPQPAGGGVSSTGGRGTGSGGGASATTTGGTGGCAYPIPAGGNPFPFYVLGEGSINLNGVPDVNTPVGAASDVLLQIRCSGDRYVLIDVSAAWDLHSQELAKELTTDTTAWLAQGGLILTVLEQGPSSGAASQANLTDWATEYGTNFSLVNDPSQSLTGAEQIQAWPALYIVRLSDMQIINSTYGNSDTFIGSYAVLLAETLDGGV